MKKMSLKDCQTFAEFKGGQCLSHEYVDKDSIMEWQCKNLHIWQTSFGNIKNRNSWYPLCHYEKRKQPLQDCIDYAEQRRGWCLDKEYINSTIKMRWKCEHNHIWSATFLQLKNAQSWCPNCAGTGRHKENISLSLRAENNPNYGLKFSELHKQKLSVSHMGKQAGENNPFAKFSSVQIMQIRQLYNKDNLFQRDIAKIFNVSRHTIMRIVNFQTYKGE